MNRLASIWNILFGRRHRRAEDKRREQVLTRATCLTIFRAVLSTAIIVAAVIEQSHTLLLYGLGASMLLDFCDGQLARAAGRETVVGAQLDGLADRLATALVAAGIVSMDQGIEVVVAATMVWIQFGVVDQFFASQFLRFGLWSPDHFHELEQPGGERVWRTNWSALAKLASNLPIVFLALGAWWAAIALSTVLIAIRLPGYRWIRQLANRRSPALAEHRRPWTHSRSQDGAVGARRRSHSLQR